ncbi:MAG: ATP-binding protein, partial [Pseudobdellovibrionaceae bacterium]
YTEYTRSRNPFFFEFGLKDLPEEPGLLFVRGPRQYGKSSWLEQQIKETIEDFGKGTAFYLNGDDFTSTEDFYESLLELENSFSSKAKVKRIFIDEVTSINAWEKVFKRAYDKGHLKKVLIVTIGSNARDILRGSEKLPGRKGKLSKNEHIFLPVSYHQFYKTCARDFNFGGDEDGSLAKQKSIEYYLLCGGSPIGLNEITFDDRIPEFLITMIQDWIIGDIMKNGRQRISLKNILNAIYKFGPSPVGYAKLAREAGLANNSVAAGYIEQLVDLLVVHPLMQWNWEKKILEPRKPCKFLFINQFAHIAFHPTNIRFPDDLSELSSSYKGMLLESLVAQELMRRIYMRGEENKTVIGFWKSDKHEIDFVTSRDEFFEVKSGPVTPMEFQWFSKSFPGKKLTIICESNFETQNIRAITLHDFLMEGDCLDFIREWSEPWNKKLD